MARSKVWTGTEWAYEDVVGGTGASWGSITGTLSNQADLQTALNNKQNKTYIQNDAPTNPVEGDIWVDTDDTTSTVIKALNYSTTEQDTGTTWIDGKKIYQITVQVNAPTTAWTWATVGVPETIENVVKIDTIINTDGEKVPLPRMYTANSTIGWIYSTLENTLHVFQVAYTENPCPFTNQPVTATIYYTKVGE